MVLRGNDIILNTHRENSHEAIGLHVSLVPTAFFEQSELLKTNGDQYRKEIHNKFREALHDVAGVAEDDTENHLVHVVSALSDFRSPAGYCEVFGLTNSSNKHKNRNSNMNSNNSTSNSDSNSDGSNSRQ